MLTIKHPDSNNSLFPSWYQLNDSKIKEAYRDNYWPGYFRNNVLAHLPVDQVAPYYCPDNGRPTKEVYTMLGATILQQIFDLTDRDTLANIATDLKWQYALNIADDSNVYISPRTYHYFRHLIAEHNIIDDTFKTITLKMAKQFKVYLEQQRLDSVHIKSNMKKLSRLGIFVKVISNFLRYLSQKWI